MNNNVILAAMILLLLVNISWKLFEIKLRLDEIERKLNVSESEDKNLGV